MASKSRDGWVDMPPTMPRDCTSCGVKLRLKTRKETKPEARDTIWFRTGPHVTESFCSNCTPKWATCRAPFRYEGSA